jgi:hypothetical protein
MSKSNNTLAFYNVLYYTYPKDAFGIERKAALMKLLFRQVCSCKGIANLPEPNLNVTHRPDMSATHPEIKLTIDFACPSCKTPWESYAAVESPFIPKAIGGGK